MGSMMSGMHSAAFCNPTCDVCLEIYGLGREKNTDITFTRGEQNKILGFGNTEHERFYLEL